MEVNNNRSVPPVTSGTQAAPVEKRDKEESGQSHTPSQQSEKLSLTDNSRLLHELEKRIAVQPAVDNQRVAAIREAIASDRFTVDVDTIADKLIRLEKALSDTR